MVINEDMKESQSGRNSEASPNRITLTAGNRSTTIENALNSTDTVDQTANNKEDSQEGDYDEENDEDYDPSKAEHKSEVESSDDEEVPDYSAVARITQVKTRGQIYAGTSSTGSSRPSELLKDDLQIDVDALFSSLQDDNSSEWRLLIQSEEKENSKNSDQRQPAERLSAEEELKIQIVTTYTFAGRLVRESKLVATDSAEARAYLNSTSGLMGGNDENNDHKSSVTVIRRVQGTDEERPLRIKLKRLSLIDKFLTRDKKNKLTTLEKSRLDWASFVDKKRIKDDLAHHNKGGYLEKQAFLDRVESKRDKHYQHAKDLERQRQWQQQQKQA